MRRKSHAHQNPRISDIVEPPLYVAMQDLAESEGISLSTLARDLIHEAIGLREDVALETLADARIETIDRKERSHTKRHGDDPCPFHFKTIPYKKNRDEYVRRGHMMVIFKVADGIPEF